MNKNTQYREIVIRAVTACMAQIQNTLKHDRSQRAQVDENIIRLTENVGSDVIDAPAWESSLNQYLEQRKSLSRNIRVLEEALTQSQAAMHNLVQLEGPVEQFIRTHRGKNIVLDVILNFIDKILELYQTSRTAYHATVTHALQSLPGNINAIITSTPPNPSDETLPPELQSLVDQAQSLVDQASPIARLAKRRAGLKAREEEKLERTIKDAMALRKARLKKEAMALRRAREREEEAKKSKSASEKGLFGSEQPSDSRVHPKSKKAKAKKRQSASVKGLFGSKKSSNSHVHSKHK